MDESGGSATFAASQVSSEDCCLPDLAASSAASMCPDEPRVTSAFSEYRLTSMQASVTELLESVVNLEFRLRNLKEDASKLEVNIYSEVLDLQDGLDRVRASGNKVGAEVSALQAAVRSLESAHVRMSGEMTFVLETLDSLGHCMPRTP